MTKTSKPVAVAVASIIVFACHSSFGQDLKLTLRNSMKSQLTISVLSDQQAAIGGAPTVFDIAPQRSVDLTLVSTQDPFDVVVYPQDEAGTAAPFKLNLRLLALAARGQPVELKGIFANAQDPFSRRFVQRRQGVTFSLGPAIVAVQGVTTVAVSDTQYLASPFLEAQQRLEQARLQLEESQRQLEQAQQQLQQRMQSGPRVVPVIPPRSATRR